MQESILSNCPTFLSALAHPVKIPEPSSQSLSPAPSPVRPKHSSPQLHQVINDLPRPWGYFGAWKSRWLRLRAGPVPLQPSVTEDRPKQGIWWWWWQGSSQGTCSTRDFQAGIWLSPISPPSGKPYGKESLPTFQGPMRIQWRGPENYRSQNATG